MKVTYYLSIQVISQENCEENGKQEVYSPPCVDLHPIILIMRDRTSQSQSSETYCRLHVSHPSSLDLNPLHIMENI